MKINHLLFVVLAMSLVSCNEKSAPNKAGSEIIVEASVVETRAGYEGQSVLPSSFVMDVDQDNDKY
ncbi:MAG: hypothetical protein IKU98_02780, partial [Bacteroidaceae bacterium]|nr:hypothetical protein [Bacteroidaceae bacterium]